MPRAGAGLMTVGLPTRSGLRNRHRSGTGTYAARGKGRSADRYGQVRDGRCTDTIGGRQVTWHALQSD